MKVTRQGYDEDYSTNVFWLKEFAEIMHKRSYENSVEKQEEVLASISPRFATIEEKMADIKNRIGFDLIKKVNSNNEEIKTASCGCDSCSCSVKKEAKYTDQEKQKYINDINNILKYIKDLCKHEYNRLTTPIVIARCKEESDLNFNSIPLNVKKLEEYIDKILMGYKNREQDAVSYIPLDQDRTSLDQNKDAEYWSHAFPQK
jgi:hypothetical protein